MLLLLGPPAHRGEKRGGGGVLVAPGPARPVGRPHVAGSAVKCIKAVPHPPAPTPLQPPPPPVWAHVLRAAQAGGRGGRLETGNFSAIFVGERSDPARCCGVCLCVCVCVHVSVQLRWARPVCLCSLCVCTLFSDAPRIFCVTRAHSKPVLKAFVVAHDSFLIYKAKNELAS